MITFRLSFFVAVLCENWTKNGVCVLMENGLFRFLVAVAIKAADLRALWLYCCLFGHMSHNIHLLTVWRVCFLRHARDCAAARAPAIVKKSRTRPPDFDRRVKYSRLTSLDTCVGDFQISHRGTRILIGKSMLILKAEACFYLIWYNIYMANTKPALPNQVSLEEIERQVFSLESPELRKEAEERFTPAQIRALKYVSYYISQVGLTLEESCLLSNVDYDEFVNFVNVEPLAKKIIQIKEIEYKKGLMHTVSIRATTGGDDKLAQWLLERRFPDEFATGKNRPAGDGQDMLFQAIEFIQKSGDREPLIKETSGRAVAIRVSSTEKKSKVIFRSH